MNYSKFDSILRIHKPPELQTDFYDPSNQEARLFPLLSTSFGFEDKNFNAPAPIKTC